MDITTIVWLCTAGACIGILSVYYNSNFLGKMVRALISIDATSPEKALSLEELNIKLTPPLKRALRPGTSFSQTVIKTDDNKYYILEKRISMAKTKYREKEASLVFVLVSILILVIAATALNYILPEVMEKFSSDVSGMFGG